MNHFVKSIVGAASIGFILATSSTAFAAPIEGLWGTSGGEDALIAKCGGSYCITLKTGKYAGKRIGKLSGKGSSYKGTIIDPADNKKYAGTARVSGSSMRLKGCALKIFCKTQNWRKK